MKPTRYLPIPPTQDVDTSPQLISVAMAHAALAAIQLALERAHPILAVLRSKGATDIELSGAEHFAQVAVVVADELAERLDDYAAVLEGPLDEDDLLPF